MIQQVGNKNIRKDLDHKSDQSFLIKFYKENGCFPQFKQVLIETRTDCNNHCPFCPHAFNKKELGIMDWNTYCKIIDELCAIGYNGRVALMLSNEPLLEDRLIDMIRYAKNKSQRLFMDITTNGRLLTVEMVDQLFANGLDNLNVNDYRGDREKNPYKLSGKLQEIYEAYNNNPKITFQYRHEVHPFLHICTERRNSKYSEHASSQSDYNRQGISVSPIVIPARSTRSVFIHHDKC